MQPLKLAPACLGSRTRDGSHGTRDEKPHHSIKGYLNLDKKIFPFSLLINTSSLTKSFSKSKKKNLIIT
jgi:hypothetical protein